MNPSELESILVLLDRVRRGADDVRTDTALDTYGRAVRALRMVAIDSRERIDGASVAIAEAREWARRRRRRAAKKAAHGTGRS